MKFWYIISAFNMEELELLLQRMGAEYVNPTCLRSFVRRQQLQLKKQNLLGGYLFAKIDVEKDYYTLMHNEMFYHNVIGILRTDADFIRADYEVEEWSRVAHTLATPLRLRLVHGHFVIADKNLKDARLVHYYRRKLKATVELTICGKKHRVSIAAYDIGNRSSAAMELAALTHMERKSMQRQKRDIHTCQSVRPEKLIKQIREKMVSPTTSVKRNRRGSSSVVIYTPSCVGEWHLAPWCKVSV